MIGICLSYNIACDHFHIINFFNYFGPLAMEGIGDEGGLGEEEG